jgi:hypothetical protein
MGDERLARGERAAESVSRELGELLAYLLRLPLGPDESKENVIDIAKVA